MYSNGLVACMHCGRAFKYEGKHCPCCSGRLRKDRHCKMAKREVHRY